MNHINKLIRHILLPLFILQTVCFGIAFAESMDVWKQENVLIQDIEAFNQKASEVNTAYFRPVKKEQIESVQQDLRDQAAAYRLKVEKEFKVYTSETGEVYEMSIIGTWEDTAHYLERMKAKDALLGIMMVSMEPENGKIRTSLQYKIYVK